MAKTNLLASSCASLPKQAQSLIENLWESWISLFLLYIFYFLHIHKNIILHLENFTTVVFYGFWAVLNFIILGSKFASLRVILNLSVLGLNNFSRTSMKIDTSLDLGINSFEYILVCVDQHVVLLWFTIYRDFNNIILFMA